VLPAVEVHGFAEVIPSMNEIFIRAVTESGAEVPVDLVGAGHTE
jgi:hypothetical protein